MTQTEHIIYNTPEVAKRGRVIARRHKKCYVELEGEARPRWVKASLCHAVNAPAASHDPISVALKLPNLTLSVKELMTVIDRQKDTYKLALMVAFMRLLKEHCISVQDFDGANDFRVAQKQLEPLLVASDEPSTFPLPARLGLDTTQPMWMAELAPIAEQFRSLSRAMSQASDATLDHWLDCASQATIQNCDCAIFDAARAVSSAATVEKAIRLASSK